MRQNRFRLSAAVKESFDNLPGGICFFAANGMPVLCNRTMVRLAFALTGRDLQSLAELRAALDALPQRAEAKRDGDTFLLPDGSAWQFSLAPVTDEAGTPYTQAVAAEVTALYRGAKELEQSNEALREVARHLRQMTQNSVAILRQEEILSMKMRVHSEAGASVLAARRYVLAGCPAAHKQELVRSWQKTLALLQNEIGKDDDADVYGELVAVADSIGAKIVETGKRPRGPAAALLAAAVRECLTNAIRHAGGNRVFVAFSQGEETASAVITNDGRPPQGEIAEGGGLSALRERIEKAGGSMQVQSRPAFRLTVTVPLKGEDAL
jgi:hypothetical protein